MDGHARAGGDDPQTLHRSSASPQDSSGETRLSVIIPAYHEVDHIAATIERVRTELGDHLDPGQLEVVVVDDGSGDGTADAAASADIVVALPQNRGKGAAVRAGMLAATGRTRAFTDADLSYSPAQVLGLMEAVESGWDMVVGNRHHPDTQTARPASRLRAVGSVVVNGTTRLVLREHRADTQCGLKAFRGEVAAQLFEHSKVDGFAFDVELFMLAERLGLKVLEVPVELTNNERSTVHVARDAGRLLVDLIAMRVAMARGAYGPASRS